MEFFKIARNISTNKIIKKIVPSFLWNIARNKVVEIEAVKLRLTLINYFRDNIDNQSNQIKEAIGFLRKHSNGIFMDE
ncbi:MAG: hypothetical protein LBQ37_01990, partial [Elusimicrobiota bacterium]|nr:hypothetical protein [Elusimicrobiota bacterium]